MGPIAMKIAISKRKKKKSNEKRGAKQDYRNQLWYSSIALIELVTELKSNILFINAPQHIIFPCLHCFQLKVIFFLCIAGGIYNTGHEEVISEESVFDQIKIFVGMIVFCDYNCRLGED